MTGAPLRRMALRVAMAVVVLAALAPVAGGRTDLDLGVPVPTGAAVAGADRTVGNAPLDQVLAAADRHKQCGLTRDRLAAFIIAPIFRESGAPPSQAPSPMTLSRWDNQSALYSHGTPSTYPQAFWHPGISPWQWDDASLQGLSAFQRIDSNFIADFTAEFMANRWCSTPTTASLWEPWFACNGGACTSIYNEIYQNGRLVNVDRDLNVTRYGGMEAHTCTNGTAATFTCWYIDPARAQGHTGWATPGAGPAPITKPFYSFTSGGTEHRHWLRAHTGYDIDIRASLRLGLNSRTSLVWQSGSQLCDLTTGAGACDTVPAGFTQQPVSVSGSYTTLVGDFGGDGRDDIFWYAPGSGKDYLWPGASSRAFGSLTMKVSGSYRPFVGDFDGDGRDDIFWYAPGSGADSVWYGTPTGFQSKSVGVSGTFTPLVGDMNGDGRDDVFWYAPGSGKDYLWRGTSSRGFTSTAHPVSGTYTPLVGDFDGDRRDDIFWYAPGAAKDSIWRGQANGFRNRATSVKGTFRPFVGDFDADDRSDVFWYAPGGGKDFLWRGTSTMAFVSSEVSVNGDYWPIVTDRNGDGRSDVIWYARGLAGDSMWTAGPFGFTSTGFQWTGTHRALVGDYDGNAKDDLLWYGPGSLYDRQWWAS